jgi:hypothetical protein
MENLSDAPCGGRMKLPRNPQESMMRARDPFKLHYLGALAVGLMMFGGLALGAAPASAQEGDGGKFLDAKFCSDQVNMNPGPGAYDGACQLWRREWAGGGWFRLQLKYNGKYLDADHCSDALNMNPGPGAYDGACQLWRFAPAGGGWSRLQLKYNGKYLDADHCSDALNLNPGPGAYDGACQLWRLAPDRRGWSRLQIKYISQ